MNEKELKREIVKLQRQRALMERVAKVACRRAGSAAEAALLAEKYLKGWWDVNIEIEQLQAELNSLQELESHGH